MFAPVEIQLGSGGRERCRAMSAICPSKTPTVFGFVIIKAAVSSSTFRRRSSRSTQPSFVDLTVTERPPQIAQLAGFVPCALSGVRTLERCCPLLL